MEKEKTQRMMSQLLAIIIRGALKKGMSQPVIIVDQDATLENIVENIEKNQLANIFKEQFQQVRESGNNNGTTNVIMGFNSQMGLQVGLSMNGEPNVPRPPDLLNVHPLLISPPLTHNREDTNVEKENFLDASDQVGDGSSDSDMEVVQETPLREV
jgi:hypothetical protein